MTETKWLASTDSREMLDWLAKANPRKLRQFACERWMRTFRANPAVANHIAVVEVYQRYLDGEATPEEWFLAYFEAGGSAIGSGIRDLVVPTPIESARRMTGLSRDLSMTRGVTGHASVDRPSEAALIRDIFGNPFRPVEFSPAWRTDTAMSLARVMRDGRDFSVMPILADALQDAGCDNPDILDHCRDTSVPHVRGCWVVDLVLNKS